MHTTVLIGGTLVELDPPQVEQGDLVLHGETIGDVDTPIPTTSTVDCRGCLVVPGLVLAHTHLYSALAAGMPGPNQPPTTFREILERVWWRLDRALDEESLRISARVAAMAAVRAGVTTLIDHHESPSFIDGSLDVIAEELEHIGLRGVLCYGATDRHGLIGARAGLRESERFTRKHLDHPKVRGMMGLHAPFTATDDTMERASELAYRLRVGVHLHAAEGPDDEQMARDRWRSRLVQKLDTFGLLSPRTLLAHGVELDQSEIEMLRDRRCWVTHQARSNMNNGVGYASALAGLERVALGTDGIDGDVLAELKTAFFRRREHTGPSVWPDPTALLGRGHKLAAELFEAPLGSLSKGAPADVVVLAYDPPTPIDAGTLGAHLVFGVSSLHVRDVFVGGRTIVRNRRLIGIDEHETLARAREIAPRLWSRMAPA
ncbi:amidohydrolase family protein [Myxococcota bacterium]|nr:amidohydrolase family protein [Myxococcota bacterium]